MQSSSITTNIVISTKILFDHNLPFDIVDIIIKKAFKRVNKICVECGRLDQCFNCKSCRYCTSSYKDNNLCEICVNDGWYFCAKHCKLQNDRFPQTACWGCWR